MKLQDYFRKYYRNRLGVEFPVFQLTCVVPLTTLSHYRASVWLETESEALFTTWFSDLAQVALHGKIFLEANRETRYVTVEK